jgi:hypothetical protein
MPHNLECHPETRAPRGGFYQALGPAGRLGGRIAVIEQGELLPRAYGDFTWRWIGDGGPLAHTLTSCH